MDIAPAGSPRILRGSPGIPRLSQAKQAIAKHSKAQQSIAKHSVSTLCQGQLENRSKAIECPGLGALETCSAASGLCSCGDYHVQIHCKLFKHLFSGGPDCSIWYSRRTLPSGPLPSDLHHTCGLSCKQLRRESLLLHVQRSWKSETKRSTLIVRGSPATDNEYPCNEFKV